tara:strand:+ start:906 stop:1058 length:153 start_codon:yes stop_codon:yes gene_type:complete
MDAQESFYSNAVNLEKIGGRSIKKKEDIQKRTPTKRRRSTKRRRPRKRRR